MDKVETYEQKIIDKAIEEAKKATKDFDVNCKVKGEPSLADLGDEVVAQIVQEKQKMNNELSD